MKESRDTIFFAKFFNSVIDQMHANGNYKNLSKINPTYSFEELKSHRLPIIHEKNENAIILYQSENQFVDDVSKLLIEIQCWKAEKQIVKKWLKELDAHPKTNSNLIESAETGKYLNYIEGLLLSLKTEIKVNKLNALHKITSPRETASNNDLTYHTFSDILVDSNYLSKIKMILSNHDAVNADGKIKSRDNDKSIIRAFYSALENNRILKPVKPTKFAELFEKEFKTKISDRSLRNPPTRNGPTKADMFYRIFIKELTIEVLNSTN